jgi:hypothetical protein
MQWLQNLSQMDKDNLNNVRCEITRYSAARKDGINELETDYVQKYQRLV